MSYKCNCGEEFEFTETRDMHFCECKYEKGLHSRDAEVDALKSENERLKVWNETLERTCSERGKQVDRHLAELAALRNRLHVAERLLRQWNIYSVAGGDANDTHRETCEFLNHKGDEGCGKKRTTRESSDGNI